uniref:non-specific serine/threonine protein kinase n=1 Tax=Trypanosoma congolense (strain IL3000) TaxID=1068625 RepID=G0V1H0_TRYCI|nr:unnamed protein product [Trypanosoma congolense IL3000]
MYIFRRSLFSLSEVLELRSLPTQRDREAMVDKILQERGLHVNLRRMLLDMLCTDAASRPTVRQVLQRYTPAVFPAYFDYLYRDVLPVLLPRPPEHQVQLLWSRIGDIWSEVERLGAAKGCEGSSSSGSESSPLVPPSDAKKAAVLVLIPIVVNACLHLMTSEASCRVISIIHRMLPHCPVEVQASTLLPYVLHCVKLNSLPVVTRALALRTISAMCHAIPFSASEATVFDDLILPCVCDIVTKADTHNVTLLLEVANQLPSLLLQARSFLEHRQVLTLASKQENSFGQQLGKLLDNGWDALLTLYKHSHSAVVIAMLQQTKRVVKFLGEERTQHDFIPFLTTAIVSTVDVQRELYPQAILCHLSMQSPSLKTLSFFVEEALRQTDTIILHRALMGVSAIVGSKLFAVGDTMSLVQYALPYIVCADKWVSIAARRVVETAARTYRMSDVCTSLPRPLLPLLHQKTPLSSLTDLPSELVQEVSRHPFFADGQPQHNSQDGIRVIGGDAGLCGRVLAVVRNRDEERISEGRKAGGGSGVSCKLRYTIRHGTTKRFPPNLPQRAAFFDVSFDPALKDDSQDAKQGSPVATAFSASETARDEGTGLPSRSWKMTFKPTLREGRRMKLRQQVNLDGTSDNDTVVGDNSVSSPSFSADGKGKRQLLMTTACGGKFLSALSPGVLWAEKELAPVAAPYFTGRVHTGGIYGSAATPDGAGTCALVTVGSRGEARLWSVGATGVSEARRLDPGTKTNNTFLFVHFLRGGSDPLLCMGGTDGILRLCDVSKKSTVLERSLDGSPLTAACALGQDVLLTSSALGSLFVMDHRVGREVWAGRGVVPAELGVMSTISPLCSDCRAYGNVVTTTRGAIALFDLRFQMLLQQYHLCDVQKGGDRLLDSPHAILCATPDVTCKPPDQMNEHPGMFLGTQSGAVYHIDLLTGMSRVSLRPASTFDASTRAMLLQPKHSLLFTAGDDMQIRKWCLVNPTQSATLVSPPYSSHVYARRASGSVMEVRPPLRGAVKETTTSSSTAATAAGAGASSPRGVVVPQHHTDAILTLCAVGPVGAGETYLASGSRNGQLTLWFNTE